MDARTLESLKLDPDFGDVELLEDIEATFDIKIESGEAETVLTVGDLFDAILVRFPRPSEHRRACLSAVSFYALRRCLAPLNPSLSIRSDTQITAFIGSVTTRALWCQFQRETGLRMPQLRIGWTPVGPLLRARQSASPMLRIVLNSLLAPAVLLAIPSVIVTAPFVRQLPADIDTVGALAREVAVLNFGRLSRKHDSYRLVDLWDAFTSTLRQHATVEGVIGRSTKFF